MTDSDFSCFLLKVLDLKPESQVSRPTWRRKFIYTKLVWENEIVIGAGPSTGDWLLARHLEEEERYLY
jgi:hypothetical protein